MSLLLVQIHPLVLLRDGLPGKVAPPRLVSCLGLALALAGICKHALDSSCHVCGISCYETTAGMPGGDNRAAPTPGCNLPGVAAGGGDEGCPRSHCLEEDDGRALYVGAKEEQVGCVVGSDDVLPGRVDQEHLLASESRPAHVSRKAAALRETAHVWKRVADHNQGGGSDLCLSAG